MTLVLGRKAGEKIVIGEDVEVSVLGFDRGRYRIRIDAPRDVPVDRSEVRAAKRRKAAEDRIAGRKQR